MFEILEIWKNNSLTVLIVLIITILWWFSTRPLKGVPPGPRPLIPILGNIFDMGLDPRVTFAKLREKYGDIFSLYIGNKHIIVISGYEVLKEVFVKNGDISNHRPVMAMMELMGNYKGIVTSSGSLWREQRTTSLAALRKLDFGKQSLEIKIHEELTYLMDAIANLNGTCFDPGLLLQSGVSNITCSMLFGQRFEYEDEKFQLVLSLINKTLTTAGSVTAMNFFPILEYLPGDILDVKKIAAMKLLYQETVLNPTVQQTIDHYDGNNCNSFISLYLKEMYTAQESGENTTLDVDNLKTIITDVFGAGTETTSTTLRWTLLYFLNYPEIQEKCYKEIIKHVGNGRVPAMKDRDGLVYIQAVYSEALRISAVLPFGAPHSVKEDMKFGDYIFPKDCLLITNIDSVLHDEKIWEDPLIFRPERFIAEDGTFIKREEFIPFFLGRRVCMGEAMSKMQLFLFITSLVQRFKFVPQDSSRVPRLTGQLGVTWSPTNFTLRALVRD